MVEEFYYQKVNKTPGELIKKDICPQCGGDLRNESGCKTCHSCFWSACG